MAITNFIPELWSANILLELQKNLVYGSAVNRDYEGDIANYGDTVHIPASRTSASATTRPTPTSPSNRPQTRTPANSSSTRASTSRSKSTTWRSARP